MKFWNLSDKGGNEQPEIRIEGRIQMDESIWALLTGKRELEARGICSEIRRLNGRDITVWINSIGGECFAASAIYTALKEHSGKVTVKIDGTAISAASVIAMAGDEIQMSPTAIMMIHNPQTIAEGELKDMEKAAQTLKEVKESILNAYCRKCGKPREEVARLMDEETWMGAQKAISLGFADSMLFDDGGTKADEALTNGLSRGARMVYNALGNSLEENADLVAHFQRIQEEDRRNQLALAKLNIEKYRF